MLKAADFGRFFALFDVSRVEKMPFAVYIQQPRKGLRALLGLERTDRRAPKMNVEKETVC